MDVHQVYGFVWSGYQSRLRNSVVLWVVVGSVGVVVHLPAEGVTGGAGRRAIMVTVRVLSAVLQADRDEKLRTLFPSPKTQISSRNLLWSLILSSRYVPNIYLPPSNFMALIRGTPSHLQKRDSSSYLQADQMSSSISANSRIKWDLTIIVNIMIGSFQISSEQFLVSTASQSRVHIWNGIHWILP